MAASYFKSNSKVLELGTGAGQDGIWLESQGFEVTLTDGDTVAFQEVEKRSTKTTKPMKVDITRPLPFQDDAFDAVYAQLVLHYFDDEMMHQIMKEIERVLKRDGVLACMVNSKNDPEYDSSLEGADGLINMNGLIKRYFTVETFTPFVKNFDVVLFDSNGKTPKDDAIGTSGMVQFIGKLKNV